MAIKIGDCSYTEAAFNCVLTEGLEYETLQEAFNAYRLCVTMSDATLEELDIKLSGLTLPKALSEMPEYYRGRDLVEAVDNLVGTVSLGIRYFAENLGTTTHLVDEKAAEDYLRRYYLENANGNHSAGPDAHMRIA